MPKLVVDILTGFGIGIGFVLGSALIHFLGSLVAHG